MDSLPPASPPPSAPAPTRLPATLTLPVGCALGVAIILLSTMAFFMGNAYTLKLLTGPYIRSSALVQGFFAKLSEGRLNARKERYIEAYLTLGKIGYDKPTGWLVFGQPAKLNGTLTNRGDQVLEWVTLEVYFVDGSDRIVGGGEVPIRELVKPNETVTFEVSAKEAGFEFPKDAATMRKVARVTDVQFYEPPKPQ
ncbi:MAG TPA: FxLYD domain-containing protein [bacterium]|nr:FxLYD domain-containing protein [bacterium]